MSSPIPIYLAVEDELSEFVLRRLLKDRPRDYAVASVFRQTGFGYLKKNARAFNGLAKQAPVLMLTDLDAKPCALKLLSEWLVDERHEHFLFRIAVREVEAWLLPVGGGLSSYLGTRRDKLPRDPEALPDPKAVLLGQAASSPRRDKNNGLVRKNRNGTLVQGPDYNSVLGEFVLTHWDVQNASSSCESLSRLLLALERLEQRWPT